MQKKRIRKISLLLSLAAILILAPVLLFDSYKVNSFQMASTLLPGDRVLIKKGSEISRQSVVVYRNPNYFDLPLKKREKNVSRLVGHPGDTVILFNKVLFINRDTVYDPSGARFEYRVVTGEGPLPEDFCREHELQEPEIIDAVGIYDYAMTHAVAELADTLTMVETMRPTRQFIGDSSREYYPPSYFFMWNRDQFGPLIVPRKGVTVEISVNTVDLYRDIIERHEGNHVEIDYRGVFINDVQVKEYRFNKNYYFVLDDNRDRPGDSRIFGFVPEDHLVGRVNLIWGSWQFKNNKIRNIRPDRFFTRVE